ncbi:DUF1318 domain-containing protein [Aliikangiella marina]|uniref:DUF1318 domain-containing protein n=1 Tax=Aliikangiella marina TaxID=1712262 RepID=A0A545TJ19_9GAMM|nr:YdbL family protein [Aliikangiella marina]TQV77197.1 DUF1318 domain-containing protein [Aliikangiella marina]
MKILTKLTTAFLVLMLALPVAAADLSSAKAQGLIGEMSTGYIGFVTNQVPDDVKELVATANAKRKAKFQALAKKQNISVDQVAKIAAATFFEKTKPGNYINQNGRWIKK